MRSQFDSPFDSISPIDSRYYGADVDAFNRLSPYLSEEATLRYQLRVEAALAGALEQAGVAPAGIGDAVHRAVEQITPADIVREENLTKHNIRALVNCIREHVPEQFRGYVHLFATSNDIMDTARALAMRDVTHDVLLPDLCALIDVVIELAAANAGVPQIGRTHGRFAEPITVGYWLANFVVRLGQRAESVAGAAGNLRGKLSGAVGAHNALALRWPQDPAHFETRFLATLGLRPAESSVSTQIVHPEYLLDFAHSLVSTFGVYANIADDFRSLMRSEIEEVEEVPDEYEGPRVGSSTMPHKVNPRNFENVKSLWKAFMPRMFTLYMDQVSEHQRDLTNSASMRFLNELVAGFDVATRRIRSAILASRINPARVAANLETSSAWTIAEPLYIALALDEDASAYNRAKQLVDEARAKKISLLALLRESDQGRQLISGLTPEHQEAVLDPKKYLGDAEDRTLLVCNEWKLRTECAHLQSRLHRPSHLWPVGSQGVRGGELRTTA